MRVRATGAHLGRCVLALLAGALGVFGWAPHGHAWVALLACGVLFALLADCRRLGAAAAIGLAFGLGLHGAGSSWVFEAMRLRAHASLALAGWGTAIFVGYLALFTTIAAALFHALVPPRRWPGAPAGAPGWARVLAFAAALTLGEYLRSLPFNGYTALSLGYALVDTPARVLLPVGGVYFASFVGYAVAGLLGCGALMLRDGRGWRALRGPVLAVLALAGLVQALQQPVWVQPHGAPLSFRLVQGNVRQVDKFRPEAVARQIDGYVQTITAARADLVVTPETAFPVFLNQLPAGVLEHLRRFAGVTASHVFLGIGTLASDGAGHNSMLAIGPAPGPLQRYDKIRLMPFGEYTPRGFAWFSDRLVIPMRDLAPGAPNPGPFEVHGAAGGPASRVGTLICHEDLLGSELGHWLPQAHVLLNPSNLAWFEGTAALPQRLQIAQARALEAGRPLLRVANTGVSAHIDHLGRVREFAAEGVTGVVAGEVQGMQGRTPYARWGDAPAGGLVGLALVLAAWGARRRPRRERPRPPQARADGALR